MPNGLATLHNLRLPDIWQAEAVRALVAGMDVIVQAPTGAGKTFVFEQFYEQTNPSRKIIYTVPTRALANDKYAEWKRRGWQVGITTGDVSIDPQSPVIVATLEAQQEPGDVCLYVVDEFQMLGDPYRGNHYEGVLLGLPATTQLLMLSGSVANPEDTASWLERLGRKVVVIRQSVRPVPLEEVDIDYLASGVPSHITGYWPRRIAGALRDDLGPILLFAPHREEAAKIARVIARALPCGNPMTLSPEQKQLAGPDLSPLLSQRVAYHHSGLRYAQRAGIIEPLAKSGQLRVVVSTLGLSAGINFSLRSVHVSSTTYTAGGIPREVAPAEILQMFGRAGRRGLDEQGYVLISSRSPRMSQGYPQKLKRSTPLPWRPLLLAIAQKEEPYSAALRYRDRLFTAHPVPIGVETTAKETEPLPCGLRTDTGRARLVRRKSRPSKECKSCSHRPTCFQLNPAPSLIWLWQRLKLLDNNLQLTSRGLIASQFIGPEGLAVSAAVEDTHYALPELLIELANLNAGDRFAVEDSRWAGRLAISCQKAFDRFSCEGFLEDGLPINYGSGGEEIIMCLRAGENLPPHFQYGFAQRGDIDRLWLEWKSILRQIAHGDPVSSPRWLELQALARAELAKHKDDALPVFPELTAEQLKPVAHRHYYQAGVQLAR